MVKETWEANKRIVFSGDGGFNEVLNGIGRSDLPLGFVPGDSLPTPRVDTVQRVAVAKRSAKRDTRWSNGMPKARNSVSFQPTPTPATSRPPSIWRPPGPPQPQSMCRRPRARFTPIAVASVKVGVAPRNGIAPAVDTELMAFLSEARALIRELRRGRLDRSPHRSAAS